ncbi:stage III sporulation protein AF [Evansella sp. LMS18]|uniref:stage III sporulation protein AF n=1 Tax=Evansella sp. LMS18 TaxID=2924033 RepID=UPI0020D1D7A0|nr:stage III sporulation protein AF [Evansella sp. LMS18]UTR09465.1 stage III sporulation protein AF [Evansella sp. LMS18]
MSMVTAWITNIILLILFATVLELILPNSKMQRYVKLVVGLMLLMVMLQPLLSVFQADPEELLAEISSAASMNTSGDSSLLDSKKMDIEEVQLAYISEQMAVQLKEQAADAVREKFEVVMKEVTVNIQDYPENEEELKNFLTEIVVHLESPGEEVDERGVEIINIDPVEINKEPLTEAAEASDRLTREIQAFLGELWSMPEEKIHVLVNG